MAIKIKVSDKLKQNWKRYLVYCFFAFAAFLGVLIGFFLSSLSELPEVSQLQYYRPNVITSIYAENGDTIQEFAIEKRLVAKYSEIPKDFINAIVSVEDERFFEHSGIDVKGIFRAMWSNVWSGKIVQGASTLTQQLSRNIFLSTEVTWKRKIKEILYAIKIEKYYTKQQILELFCNQVYFGHNRYGLAAAADFFFGKKTKELTLEECALLAGVLKGPNYYSPLRHPVRAINRRNFVLDRMMETGDITREQAIITKEKPIKLKEEEKRDSQAPFFTEEIRKYLAQNYGSQKVYKDGLNVYTTLNLKLQFAAEKALIEGLHNLDKRQGWRGPILNIFDKPVDIKNPEVDRTKNSSKIASDPEKYEDPTWEKVRFLAGNRLRAMILSVTEKEAVVRIKDKEFKINKSNIVWTNISDLKKLFKRGDLVLLHIDSISDKGEIKMTLDQEPKIEGAIVAIEAKTGKILAMVGGYDFNRSPFNRVTQSHRQAGSAFKPIVYATALENNITLADRVVDEPAVFMQAGMEEPYQPKNYYKDYSGIVTLRIALEKSLNIPAVKLIDKIGPRKVVDMAKRMGMTKGISPIFALALGACDTNPLQLTTLYSVFCNSGLLVEPYSIEEITDREGNIIYSHLPVTKEAMNIEDAFMVTYALEGVIMRGTGWQAKVLGVPLAGKTGTTDEYTDAWFIGYSPSIVCGVWVGFNDKVSLGDAEVGARAALPIWIDFMKVAINEKPGGDFIPPIGIVFKLIEKRTGLLATPDIPPEYLLLEAFKRGTEPTRYVTPEDIINVDQPYYMQERDKTIF